MSISAWPSIEPTRPLLACSRASSTSRCFRKTRKAIATSTIISGPPTNSPTTNSQPISSPSTIPSSATRFVEASSNAIAAVKSAPRRKSDRASATAAYEHDDDAAPRPVATAQRLRRCRPATAGASPSSRRPPGRDPRARNRGSAPTESPRTSRTRTRARRRAPRPHRWRRFRSPGQPSSRNQMAPSTVVSPRATERGS